MIEHSRTTRRNRASEPRRSGLRYQWEKDTDRWDLVLMGEPDCFAYIIRHQGRGLYRHGVAWCWTLTMPRGASEIASGWAHSGYEAKLQVEAKIAELSA